MSAYYNEFDPKAAAWLRELIKQGHIADGVVDERSIEDVLPNEIREFTQCHFFAGIGVWSYALRQAGWSDDRRVWTMSCPCQPFSAAGEGAGFADERHLWPAGHYLIGQCKPDVVFGEQVASKGADAWIDLVHTDMEALDYAFGAIPFPSAGVGAPHIRDRTYWVADAKGDGYERSGQFDESTGWDGVAHVLAASGMADAAGDRYWGGPTGQVEARPTARWNIEGQTCNERGKFSTGSERSGTELPVGMADMQREGSHGRVSGGQDSERSDQYRHTGCDGTAGRMADTNDDGCESGVAVRSDGEKHDTEYGSGTCAPRSTGPTNGFWRDADWLGCRDGKWRPVEPGTFPLADGAPARMGRLRGYGNAINAEAAKAFIGSYLTC